MPVRKRAGARQGSASSSRMATGSSKRPRTSAGSTGSTRSTGRSARIPGVEERPVRPKRRRVDSRADANREAELTKYATASVNRPGARFYPRVTLNQMYWFVDPNPTENPQHFGLVAQRPNREYWYDGFADTDEDNTAPHHLSWQALYGRSDQRARDDARTFLRAYARFKLRPGRPALYRPSGPVWQEARDSWLANGGGSRPEQPPGRPAHRRRKQERPVRRRRG